MATFSTILAWEMSWTEELWGLQSKPVELGNWMKDVHMNSLKKGMKGYLLTLFLDKYTVWKDFYVFLR